MSRCNTQKWVGICDVKIDQSKGRGVIATHHIKKDDIIMDYHGKVTAPPPPTHIHIP